jgi:predicted nucleic acid-binding protein
MDIRQVPFAVAAIAQARLACADIVAGYAAETGVLRQGRPQPCPKTVEAPHASPVAWMPVPTERHAAVLGDLVRRYRPSAKLASDAHRAALAIEHGAEIISADTDFARFTEIRWRDPLAG